MKREKFNKRAFSLLRFIYRVGIIKSLLILIAVAASGEEYTIKWKGRQVHLRKGTTDFYVFRQIFVFGQYDNRALQGKSAAYIVDLGANIGLSAVFYKMKYPDACLIAVEPEKKNYELLVKNTAGLTHVYCLHKAIWNSKRKLGLFDRGGGEYGYIVGERQNTGIGTVNSITMDDIVNRYKLPRIDILKIDIEGSEKELFADNYTSWLSITGSIVIELHDLFRPGCASAFFRAISTWDFTQSYRGETTVIVMDGKPGVGHGSIHESINKELGYVE